MVKLQAEINRILNAQRDLALLRVIDAEIQLRKIGKEGALGGF
jgi:hypothetical protein